MNRLLKSFRYAFNGIAIAFQEQSNLKIHAIATFFVVAFAAYYKVTLAEWAILLLAITLVITLELVNTAIEYLVDLVSPTQNTLAGKIKDIAAGAVLIASISAFIIGLLIFTNYIFDLQ